MTQKSLQRTGGCLCGAVRFDCTLKAPAIQACHCQQCQRWTGGGPLFVANVSAFEFKDDASIGTFIASDWGERLFCKTCGSTVMWKMQNRPPNSVPVGLLDDQSGLTIEEEIFVDRRPDWLPHWNGAGQSTEEQEFAKLDAYLRGDRA